MLRFAPMANGGQRMAKGLPLGLLSLVPCLLSLVAMPAAAATPAENYATYCALCHMPGVHGAPTVGDREDWARRVRPGMLMVYRNVIEGMPNTAMLALGGAPLSAAEVKAIADYMVAAAGLPASALKDAAREELAGDDVLLKSFARFDANRDGRLSEAEYVKGEATLARERAAVQVDDTALEAAVRKALANVKGVDIQYTKINVKAGAVSIVGIVEHASIAIHAQDAVKRIAGIKKLDNRLVSGDQIGWD
jgi:cytochrome c5